MTEQRAYGTHPDLPDHRDHFYEPPPDLLNRLPASIDMRPHFPRVYHQKKLNSCSANAVAAVIWFEEIRITGRRAPSPSRLFIYYNERARERKVERNVPVSLRDGYKSVVRQGVCSEEMWPYVLKRFRDRPPRRCYRAAKKARVISYQRLHRRLEDMKACLASGHPFALGLSVHESFHGAAMKHTGRASMPKRGERLLGGHAVVTVGYHDEHQRFILRNSWGPRWGLAGYFTLPYQNVLHESYAWDFWTIRA
ncbi:MAG TPA: C1 family peptidase [Thermoanaerobaculia bacterium]|nr:C1 family peptidase [Thermoanaerobaculia bacterium]